MILIEPICDIFVVYVSMNHFDPNKEKYKNYYRLGIYRITSAFNATTRR